MRRQKNEGGGWILLIGQIIYFTCRAKYLFKFVCGDKTFISPNNFLSTKLCPNLGLVEVKKSRANDTSQRGCTYLRFVQ